MTDVVKKAIEQLERVSNSLASIGETVDYTDIAIQALEQSDDWISRKALLKSIYDFAEVGWSYNKGSLTYQVRRDAIEVLKNFVIMKAPSVIQGDACFDKHNDIAESEE
jgi:uncharacterized protein Yka (UPF0111/DUF47 family)